MRWLHCSLASSFLGCTRAGRIGVSIGLIGTGAGSIGLVGTGASLHLHRLQPSSSFTKSNGQNIMHMIGLHSFLGEASTVALPTEAGLPC